jgi:hypothetical protein
MTAARIKAIRFLLQATPFQLSTRTGISVADVCALEFGFQKPTPLQIDAFKEEERQLFVAKGITTEDINKRENLYEG